MAYHVIHGSDVTSNIIPYYGLNATSGNMILADRKKLKTPNGMILGTPGSGKSFSAKRSIVGVFLNTKDDKDLLSSSEIENIFENSDFVYLLNQASGDRKILCERLNISNQQAAHISNAGPGEGLIFFGNVILPFVDDFPKDNELYSIMTTKLGETGKGENEHE